MIENNLFHVNLNILIRALNSLILVIRFLSSHDFYMPFRLIAMILNVQRFKNHFLRSLISKFLFANDSSCCFINLRRILKGVPTNAVNRATLSHWLMSPRIPESFVWLGKDQKFLQKHLLKFLLRNQNFRLLFFVLNFSDLPID